jgi:3-oxoisoapionate decarboxylase
MTIGLGTYAFFWQWHDTAKNPLTLPAMIDRTADLGVRLFQICDYPLLESYEPDDLDHLRNHASRRNVKLELGTRSVRPEHLRRYLDIARRLDATMLRSMINSSDHRSPAEAIILLTSVTQEFEEAGVTVALETYEQVPVATLVDIVRRRLAGCRHLHRPSQLRRRPRTPHRHRRSRRAVCQQHPRQGLRIQPTRRLSRVHPRRLPLGEGLLDHQHLVTTTRATERNLSQIIEHWLPWQGDSASTIRTEIEWNLHNLNYLRRHGA